MIGLAAIIITFAVCFGSIPWTFGRLQDQSTIRRYEAGEPRQARIPPSFWPKDAIALRRIVDASPEEEVRRAAQAVAEARSLTPAEVIASHDPDVLAAMVERIGAAAPRFLLGSDALGRSLVTRLLAGGAISLSVGLAAAFISVLIGTLYGAAAGYAGGRTDAFMMRIVDVLYGLPYLLLVVLIAVAADGAIDRWQRHAIERSAEQRSAWVEAQLAQLDAPSPEDRERLGNEAMARFGTGELSGPQRTRIDVIALLVAIGGVSWLTMARVIRGQVLSLKAQPFVESARAIGAPVHWIFLRHLLPNLLGPIIVYATLTVPQAILQESFLSFLGIGIKPPLPSWGNLAAEGLSELNRHRSHWWLLFFPCLMLGTTLLALNFVGEGLREAFDPRRERK
ncbi:MAG: hypothetical protein Kow0022_01680 [Phycisphaerales bacterium]